MTLKNKNRFKKVFRETVILIGFYTTIRLLVGEEAASVFIGIWAYEIYNKGLKWNVLKRMLKKYCKPSKIQQQKLIKLIKIPS
jgi:hypothetical protein